MSNSQSYICVWDEHFGRVLSQGHKFTLSEKMEIPGIDYVALYYETESDLSVKRIDKELIRLTDKEIAAIQEYCDTFKDVMDYNVWTIDPDNLYIGEMLKSEAQKMSLDWVLIEAPDHPASKFVHDHWEKIKMVIMEDGTFRLDPPNLCVKCVKGYTEAEYELIEKPPTIYHTWNFITEKWEDRRIVADVAKDLILHARNIVDIVRWKNIGHYTPQFEVESWRHQLEEADGWLKDNTYPTVYIDKYLSSRTKGKIPTKEELCKDILFRHNQEKLALAEANAVQWDIFHGIDTAVANSNLAELDEIRIQISKLGNKYQGR